VLPELFFFCSLVDVFEETTCGWLCLPPALAWADVPLDTGGCPG
jgi:hypothetical protein